MSLNRKIVSGTGKLIGEIFIHHVPIPHLYYLFQFPFIRFLLGIPTLVQQSSAQQSCQTSTQPFSFLLLLLGTPFLRNCILLMKCLPYYERL